MIIFINEQPVKMDSACTLKELLEKREYIGAHVAIAINNQFIPKSNFSHTILCEGDRIDLIVPMQGG
ncbi:thiamine biosynthesis protein ThiS [Legionella wadsworthii]|uniref:Thiamine biosynthesis protein ThiS n=1 Tax=Legionella wadsworthii TaxID=28088 RepID=A0A378LSF3_9GAMM|nr:sulfur carrier protein ThiS [Legionella wadsworthii]STY28788.1 thiamine biosynthesis protein ThiS [Legionella wadsworthii]